MVTQATPRFSDWETEIRRRQAMLLDSLWWAAVIGGFAGLVWYYFSMPKAMSVLERLSELRYFLAAWLLTVIVWLWRDRRADKAQGYRLRAAFFILIAYGVALFVFYRGGLPGSGRLWLLLIPPLSFVLLGVRIGILSGVVSLLTYLFFTLALVEKWVVPQVAEDLTTLSPLLSEGSSFLVIVVLMTAIFWVSSRYWVEALRSTVAANAELEAKTQELESTNVQLRRQASQLQAATEISNACTSILNLERLMKDVVRRIEDGFSMMGVYHVGLFLLDEEKGLLVLKAATGETGKLALEMGYSTPVDEASPLGWCVLNRRARIALSLNEKTVWFGPVPMPHTRSEITLPLHSRGEVLGALNVHSSHEAAFTEADVAVLQAMADQIATAIDNAYLFSQTQTALEEVRAIQRHYLAQSWRQFLEAKTLERVEYATAGAELWPAGVALQEAGYQARVEGRTVLHRQETENGEPRVALVTPLRLREHVIGTVTIQGGGRAEWTDEDITLAETIAEQLALTIDNLRLFEETQRRATYERLLGEIAGRVRASLNPDAILQTTAQELGRALGARSVSIEFGARRAPGEPGRTEGYPGWGYIYTEGGGLRPLDTLPPQTETARPDARPNVAQFTVPLQIRGATVGQVSVDMGSQSVTTDVTSLAQAVAEQASMALENARLFEETQRTLQETDALYRASHAIGAAVSPRQVEQALIDFAAHSGVDAARILLFGYNDEEVSGRPDYLVMSEGWTVDGRPAQPYGARISAQDYPLIRWIDLQEPTIVEDVFNDARMDAVTQTLIAEVSGLRSFAIVPIAVSERAIGALFVGRNEPSAFPEDMIRGYWTLAGQAAVALESMRLLEETRRRAEQERLIGEITARMRETMDVDAVLQTAVREIGAALRLRDVTIRLGVNGDGQAEGR